MKIERHAGSNIWSLHTAGTGQNGPCKRILPRDHIHRRSAARVEDGISRPVSEDLLQHSIGWPRNVVRYSTGKCAPDVVIGWASLSRGGRQTERNILVIRIRGNVIDRMTPSI